MTLPPNLLNKYLGLIDDQVREGEYIYNEGINQSWSGISRHIVGWSIKCSTLLEQIIPSDNSHRIVIDTFRDLLNFKQPEDILRAVEKLKAIKFSFENGLFGDLSAYIEAEIASDYMGQAEQLLQDGQKGQYDHVPAAVLAGAVLERTLRTLCDKQTPPIPTFHPDTQGKPKPLMSDRLIAELKKAGVFKEPKAKQLQAWATIRNSAAHGKFEEFTSKDVDSMLRGVKEFIADFLN